MVNSSSAASIARPVAVLVTTPAGVADDPAVAAGTPSGEPGTPSTGEPGSPSSTPQPSDRGPAATPTGRSSDGWVAPPRERWIETTQRLESLTTQFTTLKEQLAQRDREIAARDGRIRALAGVDAPDPEAAERDLVRKRYFEMFPEFKDFQDPNFVTKVRALVNRGEDLDQAVEHVWDGVAKSTLRTLEDRYKDLIGADDLTAGQRRALHAMFTAAASVDPARFKQRYEAQDPTLIDDVMKSVKEDLYDPIGRAHAAGVVSRNRAVPSSGPGRPVVTAPPNIDYGDAQAVEDAAVNYLREHGKLNG